MILEILGRPKENIISAMHEIVSRLGTEKGVAVKEKTVHDAVQVKDAENLFTTFAELTVEFDSLLDYFAVMFTYMPSNIAIIYPEKLTIKNEDLTFIGNKVIQRLHEYDAIVKNTVMEKDIISRKLQEVAPYLFKQAPQPAVQEKTKKVKSKKSKAKKKKSN